MKILTKQVAQISAVVQKHTIMIQFNLAGLLSMLLSVEVTFGDTYCITMKRAIYPSEWRKMCPKINSNRGLHKNWMTTVSHPVGLRPHIYIRVCKICWRFCSYLHPSPLFWWRMNTLPSGQFSCSQIVTESADHITQRWYLLWCWMPLTEGTERALYGWYEGFWNHKTVLTCASCRMHSWKARHYTIVWFPKQNTSTPA